MEGTAGPEPDLSREDELTQGWGFRSWLWRQRDPEHARLRELFGVHKGRVGLSVDVEGFTKFLREEAPDEPEVVDVLIRSISEWQVERTAMSKAREALGLKPFVHKAPQIDGLTWRVPQINLRCSHTTRGGLVCNKDVIPGSTRCINHGGALIDPETRRAFLVTSYVAIVEATSDAVAALVDVAKNGKNEIARVMASKEILDRAGLTAELQVTVKVESSEREDRMTELTSRLDQMQRGLAARVIDTVVVEQPEEHGLTVEDHEETDARGITDRMSKSAEAS